MVEEDQLEIKFLLYSFGKQCMRLHVVESPYALMANRIVVSIACMFSIPQNVLHMVSHGIPAITD